MNVWRVPFLFDVPFPFQRLQMQRKTKSRNENEWNQSIDLNASALLNGDGHFFCSQIDVKGN